MSTPQDPGPPGYPTGPAHGAGYAAPGYGRPGYAPPGYGQPGYGRPGNGQPGYGPPPPGYPPYGYRAPTNTMAILALVFAFVFAPVGLGLGIAARRQIARTGEEGSGLAMAGIIVGGIFTGIWVVIIVGYVILFAALAHSGFGP